MNARASGTPAKFEATPENVSRPPRNDAGQAAADDRVGHEEPEEPAEDRRDEADLDAVRYALSDRRSVRSA